MSRAIGGRMSPSLAISVLALVIAISGRAGALPGHGVVRKGDIAKGAVTASAIAPGAVKVVALHKGAVTTAKLAPAAVTTEKIADKAVAGVDLAPDAVTTEKIAPGSVTGDTLGTLVTHNVLIPDPDVTPGPADTTWTASPILLSKCQGAEALIAGGVSVIGAANGQTAISRSEPQLPGAWEGQITSNAGGNGSNAAQVWALCLM